MIVNLSLPKKEESFFDTVKKYASDLPSMVNDVLIQPVIDAGQVAIKNMDISNELQRRNANDSLDSLGLETNDSLGQNLLLDAAHSILSAVDTNGTGTERLDVRNMSDDELNQRLRDDALSDIGTVAMGLPVGGLVGRGGRALYNLARGGKEAAKASLKKSGLLNTLGGKTVGQAALGTYVASDVGHRIQEGESVPSAIGETAYDLTAGNLVNAYDELQNDRPFHALADAAMGLGITHQGYKAGRAGIETASSVKDFVNKARSVDAKQAIEQGRSIRSYSSPSELQRGFRLRAVNQLRQAGLPITEELIDNKQSQLQQQNRGLYNQSNLLNAASDYINGVDSLYKRNENINENIRNAGIDTGHGEVDSLINQIAREEGVSPAEAHAIAEIESTHGENPGSSTAGARGVFQLMPDTAESLGVTDRDNIEQNIRGGIRYYKQQLEAFDGDREKAVRAYNAGPGAVEESYGYRETNDYVDKFNNLVKEYESISPDDSKNTRSYERNMPVQSERIQSQVDLLPDEFRNSIPSIGGILESEFGIQGEISSAVRDEAHNAEVGGAPNSYHLEKNGGALDIVFDREVSEAERAAIANRFRPYFEEVLYHDVGSGNHLHLGGYKGGLSTSNRVLEGATKEPPSTNSTVKMTELESPVNNRSIENPSGAGIEEIYTPQEKRAQQEALIESNTQRQTAEKNLQDHLSKQVDIKVKNSSNIEKNQQRLDNIETELDSLKKAQQYLDSQPVYKPDMSDRLSMNTRTDAEGFARMGRFKLNEDTFWDDENINKNKPFLHGLQQFLPDFEIPDTRVRESVQNYVTQKTRKLNDEKISLSAKNEVLSEQNSNIQNGIVSSLPDSVKEQKESMATELLQEIPIEQAKEDITNYEESIGNKITPQLNRHHLYDLAQTLGITKTKDLTEALDRYQRGEPVKIEPTKPTETAAAVGKKPAPENQNRTTEEPMKDYDYDYEDNYYDDVFDMVDTKTDSKREGAVPIQNPQNPAKAGQPSRKTESVQHSAPLSHKIIPVKDTPSSWDDLVSVAESNYGHVYSMNKESNFRGSSDSGTGIHVRDRGDIEALAHEIGHKIYNRLPTVTMKIHGNKRTFPNLPKEVRDELKNLDEKSTTEQFSTAVEKILNGEPGFEKTKEFIEQNDTAFKNLEEHYNSYNSADAYEEARRVLTSEKATAVDKKSIMIKEALIDDKAPLSSLEKAQVARGIIDGNVSLTDRLRLSDRDQRERAEQLRFGDEENVQYLEQYYGTKLHHTTLKSLKKQIESAEFKEWAKNHGFSNTVQAFDAYLLANYAEYYRKLDIESIDSIVKEATDEIYKTILSNNNVNAKQLMSQAEAYLSGEAYRNNFGSNVYRAWLKAWNNTFAETYKGEKDVPQFTNLDKKQLYERFRDYLIEERRDYIDNYSSPMNIKSARKIIDSAPQSAQKALTTIQQVLDNHYRIAKQVGLLSEEQYKHMADNADFFVNLKPLIENLNNRGGGETVSAKSIAQQITDTELFKSPMAILDTSLAEISRSTEKNRVVSLLLRGTDVVKKNKDNAEVHHNFMSDFFEKTNKPGDNTFTHWVDGEKTYWKCKSPLVYKAVNSGFLRPPETESYVEKALQVPASLTRFTATNTIPFIMTNLVRDTLTAYVQSGKTLPPVRIAVEVASSLAQGMIYNLSGGKLGKKNSMYRQMEASGMFSSSIYSEKMGGELSFLDRYNRGKFFSAVKQGDWEKAMSALESNRRAAADYVEQLGKHVESFNRGIAFFDVIRQAEREGKTIDREVLERARQATQDISIDFSRGGTWSKKINKYVPFFNAAFQGVYSFYNACARDPRGVGLKLLSMGLASMVLAEQNNQYQWYKNETDDTKRRNWLFRIGDTTVKIPKPFEVGMVCNILEDAVRTRNAADFLYHVVGDVHEALIPGVMPQASQLALGLIGDYDYFYGRDIDSPYNKSYKGSIAREANDFISRQVGSQVSPIPELSGNKTNFLIKNLTGYDSKKGFVDSYLNPKNRFVSKGNYTQQQHEYYSRKKFLDQKYSETTGDNRDKRLKQLTPAERRDYLLIKKVESDLKKAKTPQQKQSIYSRAVSQFGLIR